MYKLKNQESQWCNSSEFKNLRTRSASLQEQEKMNVSSEARTETAHFPPFCLNSDPLQIGLCSPTLWGQPFLLSLLIQRLISGDILTDTLRKYVLAATWSSLHPVGLTHKISHRNESSRITHLLPPCTKTTYFLPLRKRLALDWFLLVLISHTSKVES